MAGGRRARERRLAITCPVEIHCGERVLRGVTEDAGRHGLYVRTVEDLAPGETAIAVVTLPDHSHAHMPVRVVHVLRDPLARVLSRAPGMGFEVVGEPPAGWASFIEAREQDADVSTDIHHDERPLAIVVLDRSAPLRDRVETNLEAGGFECQQASDVAAALELCRETSPDILLADGRSQGSNPLLVLRLVTGDPNLADIAVVVMSEDADDLSRLQAYRRGARDFIPKPFTDEELMIRLRRVGPRGGRRARHVALRGVIEDVGISTVLSLLEFEKRPGVLVLAKESEIGRIFVADGRILRAAVPGSPGSAEALDTLLSWKHGSFAFLPGPVSGPDELGRTISSLLVDHARVHDEDTREDPSP